MKKGFSYVDISISVGVFLIAIIIALFLIRPSIKQEDMGKLLLPSVKNGFDSETSWTIYRYPIFLRSDFQNSETYQLEVPFNFKSENINMTSLDFNYLPFKYESNNAKEDFFISVTDQIPAGKKKAYYLLYSSDFKYSGNTGNTQGTIAMTEYSYEFGVREEITGISTDKFNKLKPYSELKKQFKMPTSNDFSINVYDAITKDLLLKYQDKEPGNQETVYALQYTSFVLHENSTRMPVLVNLRVW
ncbi:MAG: hypothetical protein AABW41_02390 [Nanoarchaeota archaeon]